MYLFIYLISISGDPKSEVYGYFTNEGIFSGMVYTETDTIHIEPSHRFGVNTSHNVSNEYRAMQMAIVLFWGGGGGGGGGGAGGGSKNKKDHEFCLFCSFLSFLFFFKTRSKSKFLCPQKNNKKS